MDYLLKNSPTPAKEFFSSGAAVPEHEEDPISFSDLLDVKITNSVTPSNTTGVDGVTAKEDQEEATDEGILQEDKGEDSSAGLLDTQSIITLLQTYFNTQDLQDSDFTLFASKALNAVQDDAQRSNMEEFLRGILSLLKGGESVRFVKEEPTKMALLPASSEEQVTADESSTSVPAKAAENAVSVAYLASILQQLSLSGQTDENGAGDAAAENGAKSAGERETSRHAEILQISRDTGEDRQALNATNQAAAILWKDTRPATESSDENRETEESKLVAGKQLAGVNALEVKKLNDGENVFQVISVELSADEEKAINKHVSVLTVNIAETASPADADGEDTASSGLLSAQAAKTNREASVSSAKAQRPVSVSDADVQGRIAGQASLTRNEKTDRDITVLTVNIAETASPADADGEDTASSGLLSAQAAKTNREASVSSAKAERPAFAPDASLQEQIAGQVPSTGDEKDGEDISVPMPKAKETGVSQDESSATLVAGTSDKNTDKQTGAEEQRLLSQNDFAKTASQAGKETDKVSEKTSYTSLMADRIEKIVEQYSSRNISADMTVRLKIDDGETLLVGLRDQGKTVAVEIKTTSENVGNFLSSQRDEISRQLEERNIYTNIYVEMNNENSQRRKQGEQNRQEKATREENMSNSFDVFLETVV